MFTTRHKMETKNFILILLLSFVSSSKCDAQILESEEVFPDTEYDDIVGQIKNGYEAKNHPFHVGLVAIGESAPFCSGSLVAKESVLTAAHCVWNASSYDFKVVVGEHNVKENGDEQEYHTVQEIIIHEDFNQANFEYDFAILKLHKPVTISSKVDLVSLPSVNMNKLVGENATVFGWGLNENDTTSSTLREIPMEILSIQVCKNSFLLGRTKLPTLTSNHICGLSQKNDSATCSGDSGGGLIYRENQQSFIVGVLSASKKRCLAFIPTLFGFVIPNLTWIANHIPTEEITTEDEIIIPEVQNPTDTMATSDGRCCGRKNVFSCAFSGDCCESQCSCDWQCCNCSCKCTN